MSSTRRRSLIAASAIGLVILALLAWKLEQRRLERAIVATSEDEIQLAAIVPGMAETDVEKRLGKPTWREAAPFGEWKASLETVGCHESTRCLVYERDSRRALVVCVSAAGSVSGVERLFVRNWASRIAQ